MNESKDPEHILEWVLKQISDTALSADREKICMATYSRLFYEISQICESAVDQLNSWREQHTSKYSDDYNYSPDGVGVDAIEGDKIDPDAICPRCGSVLEPRNGRYGEFLGCSNYPNCHYSRSISSSSPETSPTVTHLKREPDYRFPQEREHIRVGDSGDIDEDYEAYGAVLPEDVFGWRGVSW